MITVIFTCFVVQGDQSSCFLGFVDTTTKVEFQHVLPTGFSSQGRAKLGAFPRFCLTENMQLSPSLTQKPGTGFSSEGMAKLRVE